MDERMDGCQSRRLHLQTKQNDYSLVPILWHCQKNINFCIFRVKFFHLKQQLLMVAIPKCLPSKCICFGDRQ